MLATLEPVRVSRDTSDPLGQVTMMLELTAVTAVECSVNAAAAEIIFGVQTPGDQT